MQAMIRRFLLLLTVLIACPAMLWAQDSLSDIRPRPLDWALDSMRSGDWVAAERIAMRDGEIAGDVIEWHRLRAGRGSYAEVMDFLSRRADWPGLDYLRRRSEGVVIRQGDADVLAFFDTRPAQTAKGVLAHSAALDRAGRTQEARNLVLQGWTDFRLSDSEQALFLAEHGELLKDQHEARLDQMLWRRWHAEARRMHGLVDNGWVALSQARIGLHRRVGNVDALIAAVPNALQGHPGLIHARFEWRLRKGRWDEAKKMILAQSASREKLGQPEAWANRRRELARDELRDGTPENAYQMAARHHLKGGAAFADLEWLAGFIALRHLNDPAQALVHFENHDSAVVSPISQGRAGYWKGRAYRALGNSAAAMAEFTLGAGHQTSFYGLLAAEAAGLPFDVGLGGPDGSDWRDSALTSDTLFQAGMLLAASGERNLAEVFWTHLAEQLSTEDATRLGQAAIDINEPHLAVMIGKATARGGLTATVPYYPLHPLADANLPVPADLALSIARRESEFDPVVTSHAGARGLMQLMPATGREVAARLGLSAEHSTARLTSDPVYNARLGTVYLAELIERFDGNIVMVSAGYNAGPGRPINWMKRFGDPRAGDIEAMVDWIEGIPFRETRNYVMRVSESLPVFRARLGLDPLPVPFSRELLGNSLSN